MGWGNNNFVHIESALQPFIIITTIVGIAVWLTPSGSCCRCDYSPRPVADEFIY